MGLGRHDDDRRHRLHLPRRAATCAGPNYRAAQGEIEVTRRRPDGRHAAPREALLSGVAIDHDRGGDRRRLDARPLRLARRAGRQPAWIVRVYVKPFVDWIWGGCLVMALGGLLAATDRRYRARVRRQRAARRVRGGDRMKRLWFLIPLAAFFALAVVLARRPEARPARGAVAADRQAGAEVRARPARRREPRPFASTTCKRQGVHPQRLGLVVRRLPRGASGAARVREEAHGADLRPQLQGHARRTPARWLARFGNPYDASFFDEDGRVGIDFGVYGVPETFVIDSNGVIRMKHIGPLTPEVLREQDRAAAEEARCLGWPIVALVVQPWLASPSLPASPSRKEAPPEAADPALEARMVRITSELRCLVCQNQTHRRLERGARRRPAARGARAAEAGQERRRGRRLHDGALRRLRPLPAAAAARRRCCSGSGRRLMLARRRRGARRRSLRRRSQHGGRRVRSGDDGDEAGSTRRVHRRAPGRVRRWPSTTLSPPRAARCG